MRSEPLLPINISYRHEASTISIRPRAAQLVERADSFRGIDVAVSLPGPLEPLFHGQLGGEPRRLASKQLRHARPRGERVALKAGVHLVVDIAYLHGARHGRMLSC